MNYLKQLTYCGENTGNNVGKAQALQLDAPPTVIKK